MGHDLRQVGDIAIHRKDTVGDDQDVARAIGPRLFQLGLQIGHVRIGIAIALRLAQAHTVDDRGMVQRVGDDRILRPQKRFEHAAIGVEGGRIEDRVLAAGEFGDLRFQLLVQILGAADEAHRGHAETMTVQRRLRRLDQLRPVRQAKIVVGAEIDDMALIAIRPHIDLGKLLRGDDPLALVEPVRLDVFQLGTKIGEKGVGHGGAPWGFVALFLLLPISIVIPAYGSSP